MSAIDSVDKTIETLIEKLVKEYSQVGVITTLMNTERKHEIVKEIAMLRASMNPECNCK